MAAIDIRVETAAGAIVAVEVRARLPNPAPALVGLAPTAVAAVLGRLYAICGAAQRACAELALAAACGDALAPGRHDRLAAQVAAEAIGEHLWRLWLDWPQALGLEQHSAAFTRAYGAIQSAARDWPAQLTAELEQSWLGRPVHSLAAFADLAAFDQWRATDLSPAARLFAALGAEPAAVARAGGAPAPLGHSQAHLWIGALAMAGRTLEALLAARLASLVTLLAALAAERPLPLALSAAAAGRGAGRAEVDTARGALEHEVLLEDGRVARYAIHTPSARHFATDGPFVGQVLGRAADDARTAQRIARLWAHGFDPCVSYAVAQTFDA